MKLKTNFIIIFLSNNYHLKTDKITWSVAPSEGYRFSHHCPLEYDTVFLWIGTDISKEHVASIFILGVLSSTM